jgi:hypothetical protein
MTESERLERQARSFEFYAGLIEKAVGRGAQLPVWDKMTAEDYRRQAQDYHRRAALLAEREKARAQETAAEPSLPSR